MFVSALEGWDAEAADAAIVNLIGAVPPQQLFDLLFRYAPRDFRSIGHKAITAANCHRVLGVIGWRHAQPLLRSLVYAMQNHAGEPSPARHDLEPDRAWRHNRALADRLPMDWQRGRRAPQAIPDLLAVLRQGSAEDAGGEVAARLIDGITPDTLWTALHAAAGELMLRQSGIISVHANTTINALHYAWRMTGNDLTRRRLILQGAAFLPQFRELLSGDLRKLTIDGLDPGETGAKGDEAIDGIFADVGQDRRLEASRKTLAYLQSGGAADPVIARARHYMIHKTVGYHDYKFMEAAFESADYLPSPWRERYLSTSVLYFNGAGDRPNDVVQRAVALLS